jgi:hypothetical protein
MIPPVSHSVFVYSPPLGLLRNLRSSQTSGQKRCDTLKSGETPPAVSVSQLVDEDRDKPRQGVMASSYPNAAFSSRNTECPGGAYGRCDGTLLHPSFSDQRFRHILSTSRSALFLRPAAFRTRRLSSSHLCSQSPIGVVERNHALNLASRIKNAHLARTKPSAGFRIATLIF